MLMRKGMDHKASQIWKFDKQSKYLPLLHNKTYKQIPPGIHFLPVSIVQKLELPIYL